MSTFYYLLIVISSVQGYNFCKYNSVSNFNRNYVSFYLEENFSNNQFGGGYLKSNEFGDDYISNNLYRSNLDNINNIISEGNKYGFLSTLSSSRITKDFPYGSIVDFSIDKDKKPLFCFSRLSRHTKNINADSKSSLVITEGNFNGLQDFRFSLTGHIKKQNDKYDYYDIYHQDHPNDFWIDFDDFDIYKMENITEITFIGGFSNAGKIRLKDYFNKKL